MAKEVKYYQVNRVITIVTIILIVGIVIMYIFS